ncbi:MAG: hypothetical protein ABR587_08430, partial [Candidatus Binatia bacterium]
ELAEVCDGLGIPMVHGAIAGWYGQVFTQFPGEKHLQRIYAHGVDGKGNKALGSPNLTDDIWLFGGSAEDIEFGLRHGRQAQMPAHGDILGEQKAHLVATYVYGLSHGAAGKE